MLLNPLTYGVAGLRRILYWNAPASALPASLPSLPTCWGVTIIFAAAMTFLAWRTAGRRTAGDLL